MSLLWIFSCWQKVSLYADDLLLYIRAQQTNTTTNWPPFLYLSGGYFFFPLTFPSCYTWSTNPGCLQREQLFSFLCFHQPFQLFTASFHPHLHSSPLSLSFSLSAASFLFPSHHPCMTASSITLSAHIHTLTQGPCWVYKWPWWSLIN